jgi:hypothetical protein
MSRFAIFVPRAAGAPEEGTGGRTQPPTGRVPAQSVL